MKLLFTYGTLKRGFPLHEVLKGQRYIGIARTAPNYTIHQYSSYPAMIAEENGNHVYGELYEVNDDCLREVDAVEGCDRGLFERKIVNLDEITLCCLPMFNETWKSIELKTAECYFFCKPLQGAANCGQFWGRK